MISSNNIIVVIPAFNEEKTIKAVVESLQPYAQEIIVVNDCSSDSTATKAQAAGAIVINHSQNKGYDASIDDGFKEALGRKATIIVTFDADGQHRVEDLKKITDVIVNGQADVVLGQRRKLTHPGEKIFALYTRLFFKIKDPLCGLKAYRSNVYEAIGHFDTIGSIGTQLMIEAKVRGFKVAAVPITILQRRDVSRFYIKSFRANYKILKAMVGLMLLKKS